MGGEGGKNKNEGEAMYPRQLFISLCLYFRRYFTQKIVPNWILSLLDYMYMHLTHEVDFLNAYE